MRILFAGTPDIAVPSLQAVAENFEIVGVLTNPDRVKGRGKKILPSPVKEIALQLGLPVIQHERLLAKAREEIAALKPDILVSFAYGRIFGPKFLQVFSLGGVKVHPSLLPKFRGAAPLQAAILSGESETGITIQRIALQMDTGNILNQVRFDLQGNETTEDLTLYAAERGAQLLVKTLREIEAGTVNEVEQKEEFATYCTMISKDDGCIDWNAAVSVIDREIRGYYPWPKAHTTYKGLQLMITRAKPVDITSFHNTDIPAVAGSVFRSNEFPGILVATGEGCLCIERLQLQSKKEMDWKSFLNGNPDIIGNLLGEV